MAIATIVHVENIPDGDAATELEYTIFQGGVFPPHWQNVVSVETQMSIDGETTDDVAASTLSVTEVTQGGAWGISAGIGRIKGTEVFPIDDPWVYYSAWNFGTGTGTVGARQTDWRFDDNGALHAIWERTATLGSGLVVVHELLVVV